MSADAPSRILELERVFNVRDLGGYPAAGGRHTSWRRLYRGDGIHRVPPDAVAALGVRTVLDLRTAGEVEVRGRFAHGEVDWHHLPVLSELWDPATFDADIPPERYLADRYGEMLDAGAESIGRALRLLAEQERVPALFHCAAGKDRTGVLASILLSLLGVPDDVVAEDYGLSASAMVAFSAAVNAANPDFDPMRDQPAAFLAVPPAAMHLFLDELRARFGSVEAFAHASGAGPDEVEALRAHLLEPPPPGVTGGGARPPRR